MVRVVEGERTRVQAYEGVCIARSNKGISSNFTVRKISYGEGVERVFPLYAPTIAEIVVVRRGDVRRAKLYYLRGRSGKSARIAERAREVPKAEPAARRRRIARRRADTEARRSRWPGRCSTRCGTTTSSTGSRTGPASSTSTGTSCTR